MVFSSDCQIIGDFAYLLRSGFGPVAGIIFSITAFCFDASARTRRTRKKFMDIGLRNSDMEEENSWECAEFKSFNSLWGRETKGGGGVKEGEARRYMDILGRHFGKCKRAL